MDDTNKDCTTKHTKGTKFFESLNLRARRELRGNKKHLILPMPSSRTG